SKFLTATLLSAAGFLTAQESFGQKNDAYELERAKAFDKVAPEFAREPNFFAYEENEDGTATIVMAGKKEKYNLPGDVRTQIAFTFHNSDNDPRIGSKGDRLRSVEILSLSKATAKEYCNKRFGFSANSSAIVFYENPY